MAGSGWKKSAGLAALAMALAVLGAPTVAFAGQEVDGEQGGGAERHGRGEAPGQIGEQRSWQRPQVQTSTPEVSAQDAPAPRAWGGGNPGGGWQGRQAQPQAPAPEMTSAEAPEPRAWGGGNRGGWQGRQVDSSPSPSSEAPAAPPPVARGNWGGRSEGGWRGRGDDASPSSQPAPDQGGRPAWMGRRNQGSNETARPAEGSDGRGGNGGEGWRSGRNQDRTPSSGDGERRGREGGWAGNRGNGGVQPGWTGQARPAPQTGSGRGDGNRTVTNDGAGREGWGGRNRGYTDPNRNGGYRDGSRGSQGWRDGDRRHEGDSGRDSNRRWSNNDRNWGDRDGRRDGSRDDHRWSEGGNRRHGPGSSRYQPNRNSGWWSNYGWQNGSWRNNRHSNYNNGSWQRWDRNWRHDRRYDWFSYRNSYSDYYRLDYYYSPYRSYNYRRLSIGFFLDSLFYSERYWLDDPRSYRLPEVYGPYRWVRYYDDVLLVNIYTGEVVDVIHDFFW